MRNNNRDIIITHLIERKIKKRKKERGIVKDIEAINENEEHERELEKLKKDQLKREASGKFVWVKPGCQILIKEGENKDERIAKFLERIEKGNI